MKAQSWSEYIFPLLIFLVYVFSGKKKSKKQAPVARAPIPRAPEPRSTQIPPPSVFNRDHALPLESSIEKRRVHSAIETHSFQSNIEKDHERPLVSAALSKEVDIDPAYAIKPRFRENRGRKVLQSLPSLKNAFIIQEIFRRPYID